MITEINTDKMNYHKSAMARVEVGNLFDYPCPVITVKTKGRVYGKISQQAEAKGIPIPKLALGCSQRVYHEDKPYVVLAFWEDESEYTERFVMECVVSAMLKAALSNPPLGTISFPLLGGKEFYKYLAAMEVGISAYENTYGEMHTVPDVKFVTDKPLT